jgi:hypothetical protein
MKGHDPEIEKEEVYTYNGTDYRILYFHRDERFSMEGFQRLLFFFKTPRGTYKSDIQVAIELMDSEPEWKDMMCSETWKQYEKRSQP